MPYLKAYDKYGKLLATGHDIQGEVGHVIITNLSPHTTYPTGSFFVSWQSEDWETEKVPVPEFTTLESSYKEITFYFKDHILVNGKSAYQVAVDNGYKGTEAEWVASIKGEKGDRGEKGDKGDTGKQGLPGRDGKDGGVTDYLIINGVDDVTAFMKISKQEYNAMRYFKDTAMTDEFMKGYDNYVAKEVTEKKDITKKEDYNTVIKGGMTVIEGNDNPYTTEIGTTIEHKFKGYSISMTYNRSANGGVWKASIDGVFIKNISTNGFGIQTTEISNNLENGEHILTLEFIGQDPDHPTTSPRGWIRIGKYNTSSSSFTINSREETTTMSREVDIAYHQSNKEYAINVQDKERTKKAEFFPYHGTQTSFKGVNFVRELLVDGESVSLSQPSGKHFFKEAKLIQKIEHKLSSDDSIRMESTFIVTFKDGRVYNDIRFKWVQPSIITSGYVFQMPVKGDFVSSFVLGDKEQVEASTTYGTQSTVENKDAKIYRCLSNTEVGKNYVYQFKLEENSEDMYRLWVQHRDANLQKLYPQYYHSTVKETGEIDIFRGYYEIRKLPNANRIYSV